jgi:hypothetical protein
MTLQHLIVPAAKGYFPSAVPRHFHITVNPPVYHAHIHLSTMNSRTTLSSVNYVAIQNPKAHICSQIHIQISLPKNSLRGSADVLTWILYYIVATLRESSDILSWILLHCGFHTGLCRCIDLHDIRVQLSYGSLQMYRPGYFHTLLYGSLKKY